MKYAVILGKAGEDMSPLAEGRELKSSCVENVPKLKCRPSRRGVN